MFLAHCAGSKWLDFNLTKLCGAHSPVLATTSREAEAHFNAGPPYALLRADWERLLPEWTRLVPRVWADYPSVPGPNKDPTRHYAEMFAYSMAGMVRAC